jgi:peptidoglycan/xylan/chitin deacetylase (PgdA/CDA1 family)
MRTAPIRVVQRSRPPLSSWLVFGMALVLVAGAVVVNVRSADPALARTAEAAEGAETSVGGTPRAHDVRPLANDCSGGRVYLTFDDGPGLGTPFVLDRLEQLNLRATFFLIGDRVAGNEDILKREMADGDSLQNHSFHHYNLATGVDLDGVQRSPWGNAEIETELVRTNDAIVRAGAPRPTLYRPPYGSVDRREDQIARRLGLRLVMPWADADRDKIVDSHDTDRVSTAQVVSAVVPHIQPDAIIAMHDSEPVSAQASGEALQAVVDRMNTLHLCSSVVMRRDATGGVLTEPPPVPAATGD